LADHDVVADPIDHGLAAYLQVVAAYLQVVAAFL
jgi:hypothetical protein